MAACLALECVHPQQTAVPDGATSSTTENFCPVKAALLHVLTFCSMWGTAWGPAALLLLDGVPPHGPTTSVLLPEEGKWRLICFPISGTIRLQAHPTPHRPWEIPINAFITIQRSELQKLIKTTAVGRWSTAMFAVFSKKPFQERTHGLTKILLENVSIVCNCLNK